MNPKPHILIIRLSALGDVAMTVPVLRVLAASYPEAKITVLSRKFLKPLFENIPNVHFYEADVNGRHKGLLGLRRLAAELKKLQITHIADLHDVLRSKILRNLWAASKIEVQKIDKGRKEKKALTKAVSKELTPLKPTVERYAEVFEKLGFLIDIKQHSFPVKPDLGEKLQSLFIPEKKHIGIAPFAAHEGKIYPRDLMEQVIEKLSNGSENQLFLFGGGKKEIEILENLSQKYPNTVNLAGKFVFEDELKIISHLEVMLAMDSGNAHLAAIYGVNTVTLWGVTHPCLGFYPFGQPMENALLSDRKKFPLIPTSVYGNKYPEGYQNAMRTITPEMVVHKVEEVVNRV